MKAVLSDTPSVTLVVNYAPTDNIFTTKIFRIILNGKTLLYSGLS